MLAAITFDHAVVNVYRLPAARRDFERLGFTTLPGGRHAGGMSRNALIPLEESSYLELLAPAKLGLGPLLRLGRGLGILPAMLAKKSPFARYFAHHLAAGEGLVDFALHCPDLDTVLRRAREAGLQFAGPFPGERTRPDGQRLAWHLALPRHERAGMEAVPFLIQDDTARELRVPPAVQHANGAHAAASLTVHLPAISSWTKTMAALLDQAPTHRDSTSATFTLGSFQLKAQASAIRTPHCLELCSLRPVEQGPLDRVHGTQIEWTPCSHDYRSPP